MGTRDHLTWLLKNMYAGQEATVRTRHGTTDWFKLGKKYYKAVHCHPAYSTYMQSSVQSLSHVWIFVTPQTAAHQASLSITNSWSLLKLVPLSQWCHPTISTSVVPLSSCLQSFPESGSFPMSQLFASGGQSIGASALASGILVNI